MLLRDFTHLGCWSAQDSGCYGGNSNFINPFDKIKNFIFHHCFVRNLKFVNWTNVWMSWAVENRCDKRIEQYEPETLNKILQGWKLNNLTSVIHYSLGASSNYSIFSLGSCRLFIIHNPLRALFYKLFHWHGCVALLFSLPVIAENSSNLRIYIYIYIYIYIWSTILNNLLPCMFSSQFIRVSELAFNENYLTSDPHIKTTNSLRFAYSSKWRSKQW